MKNISIITNMDKDKDLAYTNKIKALLPSDCTVRVATMADDIYNVMEGADAAIVLGGDGTILPCANPSAELGVPILGINLGTLGFLAAVEKAETEYAVEKLLSGDYKTDERLMLEAAVIRDGKAICTYTAINDIVVSCSSVRRIISTEVYVDDSFVARYDGDGVIFSTPTGSTGYNLSAGGPIIDTELCAGVITPICPHGCFSRSIIVPSNKTVRVCLKNNFDKKSILTADGQQGFELYSDDVLEIRASEKKAKLINVHDRSLYELLSIKNITIGKK